MRHPRSVKNAGWALITTPVIMLNVMILGALEKPSLLIKYWEVYLLFVIGPMAAGIALVLYARKLSRAS